ncbi:hypothetical protein C8F01DRAFT_1373385 [Mycena amicta]|nr:hypothetical protein C8F01DRAFT_1373385 [Mycena amicta]
MSSYAFCDRCRGSIYGERVLCLECMNGDEFNRRVDMCSDCFEKTVKWETSVHEPRHVQVKAYRRIHHGEMSWMVPEGREVAKRVKKLFTEDKAVATTAPASDPSQELEGLTKDIDVSATATEAPTCSYCEEKIALPCFVCVVCAPDAYICVECNKKHAAERSKMFPQHRLSHPLVYIFDTKPMIVQKTSSAEDAAATVEMQLKNMWNKFEALDTRLEAVEALLNNVLEKLSGAPGEAQGSDS